MSDLDLEQIQKWLDGGCKEAWRGGVGKFQHVAEIYVRQLMEEVRRLREDLARITEPSRTPGHEHTTHHHACACREAEFARWKERTEKAERELAAFKKLAKESAELYQAGIIETKSEFLAGKGRLERELADHKTSHLCLLRHGAEEHPPFGDKVTARVGDLYIGVWYSSLDGWMYGDEPIQGVKEWYELPEAKE